jgi:diguanylate cyclase (GGDEF)-like protein
MTSRVAAPDRLHRDDRPFRGSRLFAFLAAASALIVVLALGEMTMRVQSQERDNERRMDAVSRAAVLRAKVERELNSLLYLSSGLGSYLMVRNDSIQGKEVNDILAMLHRSSRHVRNFGVAIGYRLTYVYPLAGNERAIGLYYPDQPAQWPVISAIVASGKAALAGPVDLVQGGRGIIYRVPLFIDGKYWGLLSTVIDADTFFQTIADEVHDNRYRFALRGKDGKGMSGERIWGEVALFDQPDAVIQEIDVPGGRWAVAVTARSDDHLQNTDFIIRLLSGTLGGLIAWMLYALMRSRTELAHRAMYDDLTGLPNRILLEDRAEMAFARQHRAPDQLCALMFIDLDGFKGINDEHGHKAGDAVLRATAERAKAAVRINDTVARWGGDEFIVLLENVTQEMLESLMARLRASLESVVEFEGRHLKIGISMGMAVHPDTGGDLDETLRIADQRMYEDKLSRRQGLAGGG